MAKTRATEAANLDDAKATAFEGFMKQMSKDHPGEVLALDDETTANVDVIPTGAISLDVALGIGGFPRGRITELFGPTGGGKTTLALQAAKNCIDLGGYVGFVDAEHALSRELALEIGIDPSHFVVNQPDDGESTIDMVEQMLESGAFDMIIVDSLAAMTPRAEIEADVEQQHMGLQARLLGKFMRRVTARTHKGNVALVLINQVRTNLGAYGAPDESAGGKAVKFYSTIRVEVRTANSKKIELNKEHVGQIVTATVKKNKLASPFKVATYDLLFGKGISSAGSLLEVCENLGLISRAGASYTDTTTAERLGVGKEATKERLTTDTELSDRLVKEVYATLEARRRGTVIEEEPAEPDSDDAFSIS